MTHSYIPELRDIILRRTPFAIHAIAISMLLICILMVVSLFMIRLENISVSAANIDTYNDQNVVTSKLNGLIDEVYVEEGDFVKAGGPLISLKDLEFEQQKQELQSEIAYLQAEIIRINAQLNAVPPQFESDFVMAHQKLVQNQNNLFAMFAQSQKARNLANHEKIGQKLSAWERASQKTQTLERDHKQAEIWEGGDVPLPNSLDVTSSQWNSWDKARKLSKLKSALDVARSKESEALAALSEARLNAGLAVQEVEQNLTQERDKKISELEARENILAEIQDLQQNLVIRAEQDSYVEALYIELPGQKLETGNPVASLRPVEQPLIATTYVSEYMIRNVKKDQDVLLILKNEQGRVQQYLDATVQVVGRIPAYEDTRQVSYYKIQVESVPTSLDHPIIHSQVEFQYTRTTLAGLIGRLLSRDVYINEDLLAQIKVAGMSQMAMGIQE